MIVPNVWKNKTCSKPPTSISLDVLDVLSNRWIVYIKLRMTYWIYFMISLLSLGIQSYLLQGSGTGVSFTIVWRVICTFSDNVWIHRVSISSIYWMILESSRDWGWWIWEEHRSASTTDGGLSSLIMIIEDYPRASAGKSIEGAIN